MSRHSRSGKKLKWGGALSSGPQTSTEENVKERLTELRRRRDAEEAADKEVIDKDRAERLKRVMQSASSAFSLLA